MKTAGGGNFRYSPRHGESQSYDGETVRSDHDQQFTGGPTPTSLARINRAGDGNTHRARRCETTFTAGRAGRAHCHSRAKRRTDFDQGNFAQAEKQYQEILTKSPNNLYSLSNLGVVLFRNGKLKAAELTLKKAIALAPKDEFSHTTLGIVYYRQSKFDDALSELTQALAINPKSATAHNYLGITASQKGWQEAAEKEMLDAIAENPDYADAHFNLAVDLLVLGNHRRKNWPDAITKKRLPSAPQPDPSLDKLLR